MIRKTTTISTSSSSRP